MAIVDTLTVALELNSDLFTDGAKKAGESLKKVHEKVEKSTETLVNAGKKGADTFGSFRREALGALALFTGGASIAGFTKGIAGANTALGALSRQLDIAPQKLYQLHKAAESAGINAGDVDGLFKGVQNKYADSVSRGQLLQMSAYLGINPVDKNGHVRADLLDQIAHSKTFQGSSRAVQDKYLEALGGSSSLNNLLSRKDYDSLQKRFTGLGPTPEQIKQGEQLLADWTELKANTDKVMQQVFSEMEPSLHNFAQALIAVEKAHPKEIAEGVAGVAAALTVLSALLTAKSFLSSLRLIKGLALSPTGIAGGIGAAVAADVNQNGVSPWDTGAGGMYADQVKNTPHGLSEAATGISDDEARAHYLKRTGDTQYDPQLWFHNWDDERGLMAGNANPDLDRLAGAVAMQESGGDPSRINSSTGAAGLMQLMAGTAQGLGVTNRLDADQSWNGGKRYLNQLLAKYQDLSRALAAYNWGPGHVDKDLKAHGEDWQSYLPHETSNYLAKVGRNYQTGNIVHHHNTNAPNVSVVINGADKNAHEIAREVAQVIPRHTANDDTGRVM